ncbi:MAG TPA: hypothetical protein PLF56_12655, partial [Micropruina sp.]|nr:hypothetical protein [Micropruina sp.]
MGAEEFGSFRLLGWERAASTYEGVPFTGPGGAVISVERYLAKVLALVQGEVPPVESVVLSAALGRVLA